MNAAKLQDYTTATCSFLKRTILWVRYKDVENRKHMSEHNDNMADQENMLALFTSIGLSEQKAKETAKNDQVSQNLRKMIEKVTEEATF